MDGIKDILIVDDSKMNIFALRAVLEDQGYSCISASNGREALDLMTASGCSNVSVILMDMMMPEMDGYEAIGKIREVMGCKQIPIIAVTAHALKGDEETCLKAGATAYISKPVNEEKLMEILKQQFGF
jgi:two-component system cell cycle response regulator DivK